MRGMVSSRQSLLNIALDTVQRASDIRAIADTKAKLLRIVPDPIGRLTQDFSGLFDVNQAVGLFRQSSESDQARDSSQV